MNISNLCHQINQREVWSNDEERDIKDQTAVGNNDVYQHL